MACCLVRPDGIITLGASAVKKKRKDKRFAATVDRGEVAAGAELLGVDLAELVQSFTRARAGGNGTDQPAPAAPPPTPACGRCPPAPPPLR